MHFHAFQGPHNDVVEVVHVDKSLPLRTDSHNRLCRNIGYLVTHWKDCKRTGWSKVYKNTITWVHDFLVQNFFPGPTWLAAGNPRGSSEPKPPFVQTRWEVIVGESCRVFSIIYLYWTVYTTAS